MKVDLVTALKEAIKQQEVDGRVQLIAMLDLLNLCADQLNNQLDRLGKDCEAIKRQQSEPVAWMWLLDGEVWDLCATKDRFIPMRSSHAQIPLYTSAPTIPEGWQLVPIEPTPEMEEALRRAAGYHQRTVYAALLSAAPKGERT